MQQSKLSSELFPLQDNASHITKKEMNSKRKKNPTTLLLWKATQKISATTNLYVHSHLYEIFTIVTYKHIEDILIFKKSIFF